VGLDFPQEDAHGFGKHSLKWCLIAPAPLRELRTPRQQSQCSGRCIWQHNSPVSPQRAYSLTSCMMATNPRRMSTPLYFSQARIGSSQHRTVNSSKQLFDFSRLQRNASWPIGLILGVCPAHLIVKDEHGSFAFVRKTPRVLRFVALTVHLTAAERL
jgi:hypothetical protein